MSIESMIMSLIATLIAACTLVYTVYGKRKENYAHILERRVDELERKEVLCYDRVSQLTVEITELRKLNQDLLIRLVPRSVQST